MLNGKVAVVTGGARGIGAAVCKKLASLGADIAIVDLKVTEQAEALQKEITESFGVRAQAFACDVSDAEACKALIKQVTEALGSVTILVNNAGITRDSLILSMKEADFDAVINTNLKGTFNMTQACYRPFMKQKYGKIVFVRDSRCRAITGYGTFGKESMWKSFVNHVKVQMKGITRIFHKTEHYKDSEDNLVKNK